MRTTTGETVSAAPPPTCTAGDLRVSAAWEAGVADVGMNPSLHHGAREMEGTLSMTNTSATACSAPPNVKVAIEGPTGPLSVPSQADAFEIGPYTQQRALNTAATAVAPLVWRPSYCGPDPGVAPTLLVTIGTDPAAMVRVTNPAPGLFHVPTCDKYHPASVISIGDFGQAPAASSTTGQFGSGQIVMLTPSTGLHDGQVIHVSGDAYKPNENLVVTECVDMAAQTGVADCNVADKMTTSDAKGMVSVDFPVTTGPVGSVQATCGQPYPCLVAVTTVSYTPTDAAHADITFAP